MTTRRLFVQASAAAGALSAFPFAAFAQAFEQAKIINGFPAGGTADACSRVIGERLGHTAYAKNGALVENRTGAGGRIACEVVKSAPPDGSTLLLTPYSCMSIYPYIYSKLSYDPFRDFAPVSIVAVMTHCLSVGPMVPASVKTVKD
jgi:tripartite-type tricarboxylate transporter receptor subunit TctC